MKLPLHPQFRLGAILVLVVFASPLCADEQRSKSELRKEAAVALREVLEAEASGNLSKRDELLYHICQSYDAPEIKWQQGKVINAKGKWQTIDEYVQASSKDQKIEKYEQMRMQTPISVERQMHLAKWCMRQGLVDQTRSHLNQVLKLDPENNQAREALGYRYANDQWISQEEVQNFSRANEVIKKSLSKYGTDIRFVASNWSSTDSAKRDAALKRMVDLDSNDIVPGIESYCLKNPAKAAVGLEWLGRIDSPESSLAVAKIGVMHNDKSVRRTAADILKSRPLHDFVPEMLSMMATPITSTLVPSFDEEGRQIGYSQALSQERFDRTESIAIHFNLEQTNGDLFAPMQSRERIRIAFSDGKTSMVQAMTPEQVKQINEQESLRNTRIGEFMGVIADQEYDGDVKSLWSWWDSYNETGYQDFKPERYRESTIRYLDVPVPTPPRESTTRSFASECFVKGTSIITSRGFKPIEKVEAGDLVLSREIGTGKLDWKPVLQTTKRPPELTRILKVDGEQIQCTTGHLLWVSGEGWKKASEIKEGDVLHCAKKPVVVLEAIDSDILPTFNLDVADFGTYFAGRSMILSHDVKPRDANRLTVPGLKTFVVSENRRE